MSKAEPMNPNTQQNIDLSAHLSQINLYQRLGLKTNRVNHEQIISAWNERRNLLQTVRHDIGEKQYLLALSLIMDAYEVLANRKSRKKYDRVLLSRMPIEVTPIDEPIETSGSKLNASPQRSCNPEENVPYRAPDDALMVSETQSSGSSDAGSSSTIQEPRFDRYATECKISEGLRSTIYLGADRHLNRPVIIKEIQPGFLRSAEQRARIEEEAMLFAQSNAAHLVKVLDFDRQDSRVILEWLPDDLQKRMERIRNKKERPVASHELRDLLRQSLRALEFLHARGWVHGRVCASHLLLDDQGMVKLSITPGFRELYTHSAPGKEIRHLAPEMLNPQVFGEVSARSDLYALGFTLLELMVPGELYKRVDPAIHDSNMDEIQWYRWHASPSEQLPSMDEMFAELPIDLRQVLASMTQKKPSDRPEDSRAALTLLDSMSSSVRYSEGESIGEPEYAVDGVSVFGNPPTLHDARFETPMATWIEFLRNPTKKFSELNGQQKMIAASVGILLMASALLLPLATASRQTDVLAKAEKPKEMMNFESPKKRIEKPGSSSKEVASVSTKSDSTNNGSSESILSQSKIDSTAGDLKEDSLSKGRLTSFEVASGGEVLSIDQGGEPLVGGKKWKLQPGSYTAKCIDSQKVVFEHRFSVPEGDSELLISINRSFQAEETPKFVEDFSKQREPMLFRHDYQFPFVGVDSQNVAMIEKAHRAIDILLLHVADARLKRLSKSDNLTARNDIDRDPRISYLLALQGYYLSRYDNAIDLCRESIRVVEKHRIPFVLPYQLLAQVHIARRGEVSSVFAICLQSVATTNQWYQKEKSEKHLMLLSEQLWCAGNLLAHSDQVFGDGVARIVDIDYYAQRFGEVNATLTNDPLGAGREGYQFRTENIDELDVPIAAADALTEKQTIEKIPGNLSKLIAQVGPSVPQYQSRSRNDYSSSRTITPAQPSKNPQIESKPNRWRVPDRPLPLDYGVLISRIKSTLPSS